MRNNRGSGPEYMVSDEENAVDYDGDDHDGVEDDEDEDDDDIPDDDDPYSGSVLKAMVIQMRIIENHQNGKDTHVRGFQVYAKDEDKRRLGTAPSASADARRRHSARKSVRGMKDERNEGGHGDAGKISGLEEPDWMGDVR